MKALEFKKMLVKHGHSDAFAEEMAHAAGKIAERGVQLGKEMKANQDQGWKDNLMMQPVSEWDKTDRKGRWGDKVMVHGGSRKYMENYDKIDWSR